MQGDFFVFILVWPCEDPSHPAVLHPADLQRQSSNAVWFPVFIHLPAESYGRKDTCQEVISWGIMASLTWLVGFDLDFFLSVAAVFQFFFLKITALKVPVVYKFGHKLLKAIKAYFSIGISPYGRDGGNHVFTDRI